MRNLYQQLAAALFGIIELMLVFRFILKLLGASARAGFVSWIYETSQPLLKPFLFAFPTSSIKDGYILEFTTLFAIFAYAFIGYVIQEVLGLMKIKK